MKPEYKVESVCAELELSRDIERDAYDLLELTKDLNLHSGRTSRSIAASVVYAACDKNGLEITQPEVAEASECSVDVLRLRFAEIREHYNVR